MSKLILSAALLAIGTSASAACYSPIGRFDAVEVSAATASGTGNILLGTRRLYGVLTGTVSAVDPATGLPTTILYSFKGAGVNLQATGKPAGFKPISSCSFAVTIPTTVTGGTIGGKKASGSLTVQGIRSCNTEEEYQIIKGSVCY